MSNPNDITESFEQESSDRPLFPGFEQLTRKESGASDSSDISSLAGAQSSGRSARGSYSEGAEASKRKRRVYPKVRTGCDTCKRRKVKCDESGFPCRNCVKSGRECLGYHPPKARLFEPLRRSDRLDGISEEKLILYFQSTVAFRLADLKFLQLSLDFWTRVVPLLAIDFPAVRHSMLALAAVHEKFNARYINPTLEQISAEDPLFALEQYTEALRKLSSGMSSGTVVINAEHLVCCLLLTLSDLWHFGIPMSFRHVLGGLEFCRIVKKSSPSKSPLSDATGIDAMTLVPAFEYFADCAIISFDAAAGDHTILQEFSTYLDAVLPSTLPNLMDAYALLDKVIRHLARTEGSIPTNMLSQVEQHLQTVLQAVASMQGTDADRRMLHVHYQTVLILLTWLKERHERAFAEHEEDFQWIVNEVEDLLRSHPQTNLMGCIPPLFLVATKCRNTVLRHQALDVLHSASCLERLWSSCTASQVAKEVVRLEEDVHLVEGHLICLTTLEFHPALNQIDFEYLVQEGTNYQPRKSVMAWSKDEQEINVVHSRPDSYRMPPKILSMCGYSTLMLSYPMKRCHC